MLLLNKNTCYYSFYKYTKKSKIFYIYNKRKREKEMPKIYKGDGSFYYYYYKKKKGRKKKRGPKSKSNKNIKPKNYKLWDFKIVRCDFRKQEEYIGQYHDVEEITKKKEELIKQNESVEIPIMYISNRRKNKQTYDYESEYVILKRVRDIEINDNITELRNQYGKYVKYSTTSEKWVIYDKFPCKIEETFWVYGFNPKTDRKTIKWVYETFIDEYIEVSYDMVQIYVYNNKVIFRYSMDYIEFIMAKNVSDAIRIYNFLEEKYKKNRKRVIFTGFVGSHTDRTNDTFKQLKEKTGWDDAKIYRKRT